MALTFDWDPRKATRNTAKHGVTFEEAATTFADAHALDMFDKRHSDQEDRFVRLGISSGGRLIVVVYSSRHEEHDEVVRLISARRATRTETQEYGRNRGRP